MTSHGDDVVIFKKGGVLLYALFFHVLVIYGSTIPAVGCVVATQHSVGTRTSTVFSVLYCTVQ